MTNKILKTIPVIQSGVILKDNLDFMNKKKKKSSDFVKQGVRNIVGLSLISETSNFLE